VRSTKTRREVRRVNLPLVSVTASRLWLRRRITKPTQLAWPPVLNRGALKRMRCLDSSKRTGSAKATDLASRLPEHSTNYSGISAFNSALDRSCSTKRRGSRGIRRDLGPGIGRAQINDPHRLDPRLCRRLDAEQARGLATFDTTPEFPLGRDNKVLVERIGIGRDLNPLAAAGNDREHSVPRSNNPHVMLQLRHVFFSGRSSEKYRITTSTFDIYQ
jgi:hypothetical protein